MKPWILLAHSCRNVSQHEAARSISTAPGRDASPSQVIPPQFLRFPQRFAGIHLYTWVERARTWTARSGDERTNLEATAPPKGREIHGKKCPSSLSPSSQGQDLSHLFFMIYGLFSQKFEKSHSNVLLSLSCNPPRGSVLRANSKF